MAEEEPRWRRRLKNASPGILFLLGVGQSLSKVESPVIGFVLMGAALVWALGLLVAPLLATRGLDAVAGQVQSRLVLSEVGTLGSEERQRKIRIAKARLTQELEYIRGRIDADDWHYWKQHLLPKEEWDRFGDFLAAEGFHETHQALREVYRLADALHHEVKQRQMQFGGMVPNVSEWETAKELRLAGTAALVSVSEINA